MDSLWVLLAAVVPFGLFAGWLLGISGWRQARRALAEVAALRAALRDAGIAVPAASASAEVAAAAAAPWPGPPPPPRGAADPQPAAAAAAASPAGAAAANPWAVPPPPADEAVPAAPDPTPLPPRGPRLEELLTLRWGTWLGAAALLLAGVFLVRYAVEEGWLGPAARCALAALLGAALVLAAEWLRRRPAPERPTLASPDQAPAALAAGGVAVLFGAAYGAAVLYALVPPLIGFALLALAAMAGVALALLHGPLVGAVGLVGAYLTPALVETQDPSLPGLFAYLLAVTAAALAVLRQVGAGWLGWAATIAAALWVVVGGWTAGGAGLDPWAPALFVPLAAALHLALLPGAALGVPLGRRLAWVPFAALAAAALLLVPTAADPLPPGTGLLLLTPVAVWKGAREPRLDRLPWVAALAGLLALLAWPLGPWAPPGEEVTIGGAVQAILPGLDPWLPEALRPSLGAAALLAALHAAAGLWGERRRPHPVRWAALPAAVPVLALLAAYARARGFALDARWALAALALAAALTGAATLARREGSLARAGAHAAGAVAALALGAAMVLSDHWLTLAVALLLPPLAWIEARADLPALRTVALAVAGVVLVRLLLNPAVLGYAFGPLPVLNGLLAAYGAPAASFALAAWLFRRRGDDAAVAVLEAGAVALATALLLLEVRHAVAGSDLAAAGDWSFREAAFQCAGLSLLALALRLLSRRLGHRRPVLRWAWRIQQALAVGLGAVLLVANPALDPDAQVARAPVLNELLAAYAIPAAVAASAARARGLARAPAVRAGLAAYAAVAAFAWVTLEVRRAFHPDGMALAFAEPEGAELYAYSGAWLVLAAALLALGIRTGAPALRAAALALMALTVLKAVLVDMAELVGLWRVLSFLGLGLALIALGWVYRRFVVTAPPAAPATPAPAPPA